MASKFLLNLMDDIINDFNSKTDKELFDELYETNESFIDFRKKIETKIAMNEGLCELTKYVSIENTVFRDICKNLEYNNFPVLEKKQEQNINIYGDASCQIA